MCVARVCVCAHRGCVMRWKTCPSAEANTAGGAASEPVAAALTWFARQSDTAKRVIAAAVLLVIVLTFVVQHVDDEEVGPIVYSRAYSGPTVYSRRAHSLFTRVFGGILGYSGVFGGIR